MGLSEWFRGFCSNIKVKDSGSISTRYRAITLRLNTDFWDTDSDVSHSLYVGSYGRNTAIKGFSDLDMIFRLPYSTYARYNQHVRNGQSALLQAVKRSVERTYARTNIGADGQVIQIPFNDGLKFELVPTFINNDDSYTFPDSNNGGRWKVTNPTPEIIAIRTRNNACNRNLIPLCRMMRAWKRNWKVPISGLLIDTLAFQFIEDWEYRHKSYLHYDFMSRDFFRYMANQNKNKNYWRAPGSGQYVYGKGQFQWKATRCYNLALEAIQHEMANPKREWSAKQKWREVFGVEYPK